ncbi:cytochrome P450 [Hygrophoropsis aurantiaca]|uniref:Cytochrome P450 n=1 Tax=Hygrophoropsis aurantiaca TaxID=72124 RepID=A0ACB8A145_9AGAM|nr:cytochrome P450 [Hygrophoropsis aurantiaca]
MPSILTPQFALLLPMSIAAIAFIDRLRKRNEVNPPLPPGPKPLPFVGNAFSIDTIEPWNTYEEWGALHGDLVYARLFNQNIIIVNSEKIAKELLEKRSNIYSGRPFIATIEPFGWTYNVGLIPYGDEWRLCRRMIHQNFRPEASLKFRPMQLRKVHQLLTNLLESPDDYFAHVCTFAAAVGMSSVYDYDAAPQNDPLVEVVDKALYLGLRIMTPERAMLLDRLPFLARLPLWFPGATISRDAATSRQLIDEMVEKPLQYVRDNMATGTAAPSLVLNLLQRHDVNSPQPELFDSALRKSSSTAFAASAETTSSSLLFCILALVLNPDIQEKAYAQIKAVVGTERLPNFEDSDSLPYIEGIVRESMRWQPVLPMGVMHATTADDAYEGFFIPKGSTIIANAWAMAHNEAIYPNAHEFRPEKWLDSDGQLTDAEPPTFTFGFGRRICPGRHAATASLWAAIASFLATFKFMKAQDAQGNDVDFVPTYVSGLTRHPNRFPLRVVPRNSDLTADKLANLVRASE